MAQKERFTVTEMVTPTDARITYGTAAPTVGANKVGNTVYNTAPTAEGVFCWVCVAAGTPGTWKTVAVGA